MADFSYKGSFFRFDWQNIGADMPHFDTHTFVYTMRYRLANDLKEEVGIVTRMLQAVTRTWEHDVDFTYDIRTYGDTFSVIVTTKDEIFWYLNNGTDERYAVMSQDFEPKTHVRTIGSQIGRGGRVGFVETPLPGIEAREWIDEIAKRREKDFQKKMSRTFNSLVDRFWREAHQKGR